jgi:hypothetical protein
VRARVEVRRAPLERPALFVACAVLFFAGCSTVTPSAPAFVAAGPQGNSRVAAAPLGEVFTAGRIVVKKRSCIAGQSGEATFSAKGHAGGPYAGDFVASGQWNFYRIGSQSLWTFAETFKIAGRRRADGTVTGNGADIIATCKTFGPVSSLKDLKYHLGTASGAATTNLMKNGGKLVQRLH